MAEKLCEEQRSRKKSPDLVSLYRIHDCLVYTKKYNQLLKKI